MRYIRTYPQSGLHVGERRGDRLLLGAHCRASDRVRAIGFRADMTFHLVRRCVDDPFDCEVHEEVLDPSRSGRPALSARTTGSGTWLSAVGDRRSPRISALEHACPRLAADGRGCRPVRPRRAGCRKARACGANGRVAPDGCPGATSPRGPVGALRRRCPRCRGSSPARPFPPAPSWAARRNRRPRRSGRRWRRSRPCP